MNFREIAKDYNDVYGFNLLPLINKVPTINWEHWQSHEMGINDLDKFEWNSNTNGIGAISGVHDLRCLDFDDVKNFKIIEEFLKELGLPDDYLWLVKSGSGKGYHIWFYCDNDTKIFKDLNGEKSNYKLDLQDKSLCNHMELRWKNCQTVLPPSEHPSGGIYKFEYLNVKGIPGCAPYKISAESLIDVIKKYCIIEIGASREIDGNKTKETKYLLDAAKFIKGRIDNYDDFLRIGFALASLGEAGRKYFILVGKDNPNYPDDTETKLNKKFDGFLKDYRGDIKLGTFYSIAKKYGYKFPKFRFWEIKNRKANIKRNLLIEFLAEEGFGKMWLGKDYIFIKVRENVISEVSTVQMKEYVLNYLNEFEDETICDIIKEEVIKIASTLFSDSTLECLRTYEMKFPEITKEKEIFYFKNVYVEATADNLEIKEYKTLDGYVWENQIINRNFMITEIESDFEKFINNVCRNNIDRIEALKSAIGYLLHSYKDPTKAKAIIFIDEKLSDSAFGRSGKGLVAKAIKELKVVKRIDGKNFKFDKNFPFQSITADTQIMVFDDVTKKFSFENLFSIITEGITIEKKNRDEFIIPFEKSPKILITTNHSIIGNDDSSKARQFVVEFSDHYNAKHEPKDDFGKLFFNDWDEIEWQAFDNLMIKCCQYYLKNGLKEYKHINLIKKKLIDSTSAEFEEFIRDVPLNQELHKKELFEKFKNENPDFGQLKQNTFSKWIKIYAELNELRIEERKSGADRYITFREKS